MAKLGTYENRCFLSGRVAGVYRMKKNEVVLALLVGRTRRQNGKTVHVRTEDGKVRSDLYSVHFFDGAAKIVEERYQAGDFVNVNAVAMTIRDRYTCSNKIELWGIRVSPKASNGRLTPDLAQTDLAGTVVSTYSGRSRAGRDYTSLTVYVNVTEQVVRPDGTVGPQDYHTYLTVGVNGERTRAIAKELKKGDWVHVYGRIRERKQESTGHKQDFLDVFFVENLNAPVLHEEEPEEDHSAEDPVSNISNGNPIYSDGFIEVPRPTRRHVESEV